MGGRGTWATVGDRSMWTGRRDAGRAHLKSARDACDLADEGDDTRLAVQGAILSAIAYGDALTIRIAGIRNGKDHRRLVDALRHALGNRIPQAELTRVERLLRQKDDSAYGHRMITVIEGRDALEKATAFAAWAELELARG
jgi:hypothetical protein